MMDLVIAGSWIVVLLFKVTLILIGALTLAGLCAGSRASVRHLVLASGFAALLVLPLAEAVVPAIVLRVPVVSSFTSSTARHDALELRRSNHTQAPVTSVRAAATTPSPVNLEQFIIAAWFVGMLVFSAPVIAGMFQVRRLYTRGRPCPAAQAVVDHITARSRVRRHVRLLQHDGVRGPITCGCFKPAILVPPGTAGWAPNALRQALAHEVEHVRRGDWLIHCLSRLVCAMYWFHPLVWSAWRRLRLEAERACDDAVVGHGEARDYAALLISVAEQQARTIREPILAMASRGDLSVRIAALLNRQVPRGGVSAAWVIAAAAIAVTVSSTLGPVAFAQSPSGSRVPSSERSFEVVSIKRNVSGNEDVGIFLPTGASYNTTNATMLGTIMRAYQVKHVENIPDWVENERYDITAKAASKPTADEVNAMLRTMLKERLKLQAHIEPREIPAYAMVVARPNHAGLKAVALDCEAILAEREAAMKAGRPQMPTAANGAPQCWYTWSAAISSGGITMARLAGLIDWVAGRVVVDRTGLRGVYEFTLTFAPPTAAVGAKSDDRPDLFTALPDQLGLKLEPVRAAVDSLIIDSIERPTEN